MIHPILQQKLPEVMSICKQHRVKQLYAFGSVCTDKFNNDSDIDFIISFDNSYFDDYADNYFSLEAEQTKALGRKIDLVTDKTIQNPYFKKVVEKTKTPIYE
jgi:predicted nucleotidyltransferase